MPRRDRLAEVLSQLAEVRRQPASPEADRLLRRVLEREDSHAVAKAARIAGEAGLGLLGPALAAAFARFLSAPWKQDQGCAAKTAIVEALARLEYADDGVFRAGLGHVQLEPVWGGQVDAAVDLRSASAFGLARSSRHDVLELLAELLADPEPPARVSAARAIAAHGGAAALPLLRYKALAGDDEPRVVTECLLGLLRLDERGSLPFVARLLEPLSGRPLRDRASSAAAALGESRLTGAFAVLRDWHPSAAKRGLGRLAAQALASLRRDEAFEFLLALVREADLAAAREAALALAEGADTPLRRRLRQAVAGRVELADRLGDLLRDAAD